MVYKIIKLNGFQSQFERIYRRGNLYLLFFSKSWQSRTWPGLGIPRPGVHALHQDASRAEDFRKKKQQKLVDGPGPCRPGDGGNSDDHEGGDKGPDDEVEVVNVNLKPATEYSGGSNEWWSDKPLDGVPVKLDPLPNKRMVGTLNGQVLVVSGAPSHYDSLNWRSTWGVLNCQCKETAEALLASASAEVQSKVLMINPNHIQHKKWFNASLLLATHLFLKS